MSNLNTQWRTRPLGDICKIVGGGTPSKKNEAYYQGDIPWVTVRDMNQDIITETSFRITEDAVKNSSTNIIEAGNVVIATRVGLGKVCLLKQDTAINQDLRAVIPKKDDTVSVLFLFWWLKSIAHVIEQEGTGATVKGVKLPFVKSLPLPLPPIPEQKRIVSILDEVFEGIGKAVANVERNLENSRELFESYVDRAFLLKGPEWVDTKINKICEKVEYGSSSKSKKTGAVPVLRMGNIQDREFEWGKLVYTDNKDEIKKYLLNKGDVLFNRTNSAELVGKTAIFRGDREAIFAGYLIRIHRKPDLIDAEFLNYYLNSSPARDYGKSVMSCSVNQANINGTKLKQYPISIPSLHEQQKIVEKFNAIKEKSQELEIIYQKKLTALEELKQSILQKAFTGELTSKTVDKLMEPV